jgi:O-antigen biosynthesis protein
VKQAPYQNDLSVIIVNYNVEFFLKQCLDAVMKAIKHLSVEVWVVDNNSIDGSLEMVNVHFPSVKIIANKDNVGFSKANNQAIEKSDSRYVLLLNPDTVIEEDTLVKVVEFMDEHTNAGGLGVRMVDGKGQFLPESKRGLPTPMVSFYKIFGLSKLFPHSKKFGQYHLGYLSEFEVNEIDVLSGAFMLMRSEALVKVGLLDEQFFMYGEDIDLSYRIQLGGYKNYYFPKTKIIHYKGESTKKSSVNYVFIFYRAMVIFAKKHFAGNYAKMFGVAINFAIYLRASIAILNRLFQSILFPIVDFTLILTGFYLLTNHWNNQDVHFPKEAFYYLIPAYAFIWITFHFFNGVYDREDARLAHLRSSILGLLFILVVYALLPKSLQFSRLFILIGFTWVLLSYFLRLMIVNLYKQHSLSFPKPRKKKFAIVGDSEEFGRVSFILNNTYPNIESIIGIYVHKTYPESKGSLRQMDQVLDIYTPNEIIFCSKEIDAKSIINTMILTKNKDIDFKIAPAETNYLIGSNSIDSSGELYLLNFNAIQNPENIKSKRLLDIILSLNLLLFTPILILFYKHKISTIKNILYVLIGKKTFVGYHSMSNDFSTLNLPKLKPGVLVPFGKQFVDLHQANLLYARNYNILTDLKIIMSNINKLGET